MTKSDTLLKAALKRLKARVEEKIVDSAAELSVIMQEAPSKIQAEWEILKEEIYEEAEKIENDNFQEEEKSTSDWRKIKENQTPIKKIDIIRAKVLELTKKVETKRK